MTVLLEEIYTLKSYVINKHDGTLTRGGILLTCWMSVVSLFMMRREYDLHQSLLKKLSDKKLYWSNNNIPFSYSQEKKINEEGSTKRTLFICYSEYKYFDWALRIPILLRRVTNNYITEIDTNGNRSILAISITFDPEDNRPILLIE